MKRQCGVLFVRYEKKSFLVGNDISLWAPPVDTIEKLLLPSFLNYLRLKKLTNMFYFESRKPTSHAIKIKNVPSNRTCPKVNIRRRLLRPHGDQRLINFTQAVMPLYKSSILPQKSCTVSLLKLFCIIMKKKTDVFENTRSFCQMLFNLPRCEDIKSTPR